MPLGSYVRLFGTENYCTNFNVIMSLSQSIAGHRPAPGKIIETNNVGLVTKQNVGDLITHVRNDMLYFK